MTAPQPNKPDESLLEEIFPLTRIPASEIGGFGLEIGDYMEVFGDRTWTEVEADSYRIYNDAYSLMDPKTLVYYIAGFMRLALSDNSPDGDEFFVYFARSKRFIGFCNLLTIRQRSFVIQFIDYYIQSDYYSDKERIPYAANREQIVLTLGTPS